MFWNMWNITFLNAYCYPICVNWKVFDMTGESISSKLFMLLTLPLRSFSPLHSFYRFYFASQRVYKMVNLTPKKSYSTVNSTSTLAGNNGTKKQPILYKPETLALQHIESNTQATTSKAY
uniref:Uncharacterized protein n=1 Tax=Morchella importuna TaxID=1174673 RepID=A0A650AF63_9PEZI|nr:hypothetical protein [Morchella importuna]QGN66660.1 hypothetical protein [Morchella importuna]